MNLFFISHIPVLIVVIPLCAAVLCPLLSRLSPSLGKRTVIVFLFVVFVLSLIQLAGIVQSGEAVHYYLGGWEPPYGVEFVIERNHNSAGKLYRSYDSSVQQPL